MTTFKATIHDGQLQFDHPLNLPEGAQVEVIVRVMPLAPEERGLTLQDIESDSPEAIERWIAYMDSIPAPTMTDEEWETWQQRRREDREWEFAHAAEREQRIDSYFQ
jgi:hypothetical protein